MFSHIQVEKSYKLNALGMVVRLKKESNNHAFICM